MRRLVTLVSGLIVAVLGSTAIQAAGKIVHDTEY